MAAACSACAALLWAADGLGPVEVGLGGGHRRRPDRPLMGFDGLDEGGGRVGVILRGRGQNRGIGGGRRRRDHRADQTALRGGADQLGVVDLLCGGGVGPLPGHRRGVRHLDKSRPGGI